MSPENRFGILVGFTAFAVAVVPVQTIEIRKLRRKLTASQSETHLWRRQYLTLLLRVDPALYAAEVENLQTRTQFDNIMKNF